MGKLIERLKAGSEHLTMVAWIVGGLVLMAAVAIGANEDWRSRVLAAMVDGESAEDKDAHDNAEGEEESEEQHALALTDRALRNIGIGDEQIQRIEKRDYEITTSFPAMVVERPGRSIVKVPAPATGVVTRVYREQGVTVETGQRLFELGLNHEELIQDQAEYLATLQKLGTVEDDLARLDSLPGGLADKEKRERGFEKIQLDATLKALCQVLVMHGLTEKQVDETLTRKQQLVKNITVSVPEVSDDEIVISRTAPAPQSEFEIQELLVTKGQQVATGDPLCVISNHARLQVEGHAFEHDTELLLEAVENNGSVVAVFEGHNGHPHVISGLHVRNVASSLDVESRTLSFYVEFPNESLSEREDGNQRFVNWRYKPGQRCRLEISTETIHGEFVVPTEAVAFDGADAFLFIRNGFEGDKKVWQRTPVHVLHRGPHEVVVDNDGAIYAGTEIATTGAGQLLIALGSGSGKLQNACPCPDHEK